MEDYRPEEAFDLNLWTIKLFGVLTSSVKHPLLRLIYQIYGYAIHSIFIISFFSTQVVQLFITRGDLKELVDSSFFALACVGYIPKLLVIILRRKKLEEFFERLHAPIFAPKTKGHLKELKKSAASARAASWIFFSITFGTCCNWIIIPFVDHKQEKSLLYPAWYPYNVQKNPAYAYTFVYQGFFIFTAGLMDCMIDMMTTNFYVVMIGQMEILKQEFRQLTAYIAFTNVKKTSFEFSERNEANNVAVDIFEKELTVDLINCRKKEKTKSGFHLESNMNVPYCNAIMSNEILNDRIIKCTLRYQAIIKFIHDVTEFFQIGIIAQVCVSSIVICTTTYEMTLTSPATSQFYCLMQYQACMLFQIFIYSWRGNEITVKIAELKNAIYECGWMSIPNVKFRRSLCIIMSPLQIPLVICVGKFFPLTVNTFFKIIKIAYSFYVLLKQVNFNNK